MKKILKGIDRPIFLISIAVSIIVILILLAAPEQSEIIVDQMLHFMEYDLGFLYVIIYVALVAFLIWLSFSRYGKIVLGAEGEKPEYNDFSWMSMMFCTGIASSLMIFSFIEPIYYLTSTPFGIEAQSVQAYEYAHMYGQFHWGPSAWLFYAPAAVAIAYQMHVKKRESVRLGDICTLSRKKKGWISKMIDIFTVFAVLGGIGTSMGISAPLICRVVSNVFHIPNDGRLLTAVFLLWFAIFTTSVWRGLDKGIKILSDINIYIAVLFIGIVFLLAGPGRVLDVELNSIGLYAKEFFRMSTYTDPFGKSGFPQQWTIFYWGWWLSYIPIMGLFTARISRGRTIRQVILGMIGYGSLGCVLSFSVLGCYALDLQLSGKVDLVHILNTQGKEEAVIAILNTLPFADVLSILFCVVAIIFMATTIDSSAFILASVTSKNLRGDQEPARWNRVVWSVVFVVFALSLTRIGGLDTMQTASVLTGLPMIFICFLVLYALSKMVKEKKNKIE
ncbi:MAG TPA: BCCT family transporter [Candidatus Mediterraneibacter merdipullorum]|nr:BCCT family transporter [Candidatus Mediterraneibacter merdipullorum]